MSVKQLPYVQLGIAYMFVSLVSDSRSWVVFGWTLPHWQHLVPLHVAIVLSQTTNSSIDQRENLLKLFAIKLVGYEDQIARQAIRGEPSQKCLFFTAVLGNSFKLVSGQKLHLRTT